MTDYLDTPPVNLDADLADAFDELPFWSSRFGALLLEHVPIAHDMSILDIGCGTGFPLLELAAICGGSCRLAGVDLWKEAIERAGRKARFSRLDNVTLHVADAAQLPFGDGEFDLIVSNLGVNNFSDVAQSMRECHRVLKAGGTIALTTNLVGHMRELYEAFRIVLEELGNPEHLVRLHSNEQHRGTVESHSHLLEESGFSITKAVTRDFQLRYLDGSAMLRHPLVRMGFLPAWRAVVAPEVEREVFERLEARLNETSSRDGELRLTVPMLYLEGARIG